MFAFDWLHSLRRVLLAAAVPALIATMLFAGACGGGGDDDSGDSDRDEPTAEATEDSGDDDSGDDDSGDDGDSGDDDSGGETSVEVGETFWHSGFEVTVQTPFTFLPAPFNGFGGQLSYTDIQSEVAYVVSAATAGSGFVNAPIVGQSPTSISATLYYENGPFEARISGVSRDEYLTLVPAVSGNDVEGKASIFNLDFSASYEVNDNLSLTFEAINLTDQFDERWIHSVRKNSLNYEHTGSEFVVGLRYKN
jgi:outer membrane receptor protein involved in Fe transport